MANRRGFRKKNGVRYGAAPSAGYVLLLLGCSSARRRHSLMDSQVLGRRFLLEGNFAYPQ
jgi:hypothetical protein